MLVLPRGKQAILWMFWSTVWYRSQFDEIFGEVYMLPYAQIYISHYFTVWELLLINNKHAV